MKGTFFTGRISKGWRFLRDRKGDPSSLQLYAGSQRKSRTSCPRNGPKQSLGGQEKAALGAGEGVHVCTRVSERERQRAPSDSLPPPGR